MRLFSPWLLLLAVTYSAGCGASKTEPVATDQSNVDVSANDHSGWWCVEHGVPEEECALCDTSLVAVYKTRGDWCEAHQRPESQCFVCSPERFEKFAAQYKAKFGEAPAANGMRARTQGQTGLGSRPRLRKEQSSVAVPGCGERGLLPDRGGNRAGR